MTETSCHSIVFVMSLSSTGVVIIIFPSPFTKDKEVRDKRDVRRDESDWCETKVRRSAGGHRRDYMSLLPLIL